MTTRKDEVIETIHGENVIATINELISRSMLENVTNVAFIMMTEDGELLASYANDKVLPFMINGIEDLKHAMSLDQYNTSV